MSSIGQRRSQASLLQKHRPEPLNSASPRRPACFSSCSGPRRTVLCGSLVPSRALAVTPQTTPRTRPHRLHKSSRSSPSQPPPSLRRRRRRHRRRPAGSSAPTPLLVRLSNRHVALLLPHFKPCAKPPLGSRVKPRCCGTDSHPLHRPASSSPAQSCFQFPEPGAPDALQTLARRLPSPVRDTSPSLLHTALLHPTWLIPSPPPGLSLTTSRSPQGLPHTCALPGHPFFPIVGPNLICLESGFLWERPEHRRRLLSLVPLFPAPSTVYLARVEGACFAAA